MVHTREPQRNFLPNPAFSDGCWNGPRLLFKHNLDDTKQKLDQFLKFNDVELKSVTKNLDNYRSDCFFCDISPLGLYLGKKNGNPILPA